MQPGVYSAFYCSQTQEMTGERCKNNFFPDWNCYVILADITSDRSRSPMKKKWSGTLSTEIGGTFLSEDYKPEVLEALAALES